MNEIIAWIIIFVGLIFNVVGCIGLVRMPSVYTGLQSAAKCVTLGTCSILLGTACLFWPTPIAVKALICIAFIAVTTPTAAHAIARAAHKFGVPATNNAVGDQYDHDIDPHDEREDA